jgi:hypothetical protein
VLGGLTSRQAVEFAGFPSVPEAVARANEQTGVSSYITKRLWQYYRKTRSIQLYHKPSVVVLPWVCDAVVNALSVHRSTARAL